MMLQIKNMESERCIMMVKNELNKFGLHYKTVELGEVELKENISNENFQLIDIALRKAGLELMLDKSHRLVEKIKEAIFQLIHLSEDIAKPKFSNYIKRKVNYDYTYLSNLFSRLQGISIEKYIISQKIEYIKELLIQDKLSLNDIAFKLHYNSVAYLSKQFKKIAGLTPTNFKNLYQKELHQAMCE